MLEIDSYSLYTKLTRKLDDDEFEEKMAFQKRMFCMKNTKLKNKMRESNKKLKHLRSSNNKQKYRRIWYQL